MRKPLMIITAILTLSTMNAEAHGVLTDVRLQVPSVVVKTLFTESQPVVDATVTIFAPASAEVVWQTGRTDQTGSFAFLPDTSGDWIFIVDDQKGHAKKLTITVSDEFIAKTEKPAVTGGKADLLTSRRERIYQTITGLALIFGITGIFYGVRLRQTAQNNSVRK